MAHSPTGERNARKPYPKCNEPRTFGVRQDWLDTVAEHIKLHDMDASPTPTRGSLKRLQTHRRPSGVGCY